MKKKPAETSPTAPPLEDPLIDDPFVMHGDGSLPHDKVRERQMGELDIDPTFIEQMTG